MCSAPQCMNKCKGSREQPKHTHTCGGTACFGTCSVQACEHTCSHQDHHRSAHARCDCGQPHRCTRKCQAVDCDKVCAASSSQPHRHSCISNIQHEHQSKHSEAGRDSESVLLGPEGGLVAVPGCLAKCYVSGCARRCGNKDHHHARPGSVEHFCGFFHVCAKKCAALLCNSACNLDLTSHHLAAGFASPFTCFFLAQKHKY